MIAVGLLPLSFALALTGLQGGTMQTMHAMLTQMRMME